MENELKLLKLEDNDFCRDLIYIYRKMTRRASDKDTINTMKENARKTGTPITLEQGNLSDSEYLKKILPIPSKMFFLLNQDKPVGMCMYDLDENQYAFLTYEVLEEFRGKGYATTICNLIEEELFKDPTIKGLFIADYTVAKVSSRIANKLGYTSIAPGMFLKDNPNFEDPQKLNLSPSDDGR